MRQAPGEAVQKLCPRCSALAYTGDRRCPWCGGSYSRRLLPAIAALLLLQTALLVAGIAYVGVVVGDEVNTRIDREVYGDTFAVSVDAITSTGEILASTGDIEMSE